MDRRSAIISELTSSLKELESLYRSLKPEEYELRVYEDGERWSVIEMLAHLITIEKSMQSLFKNILSGGEGAPPDFDVERFNRSQPKKISNLSIDELIGLFQLTRQSTITIVKDMDEKDLDREGKHAYHGHGTLERFIRWAYEHQRIHLEDVQRRL